MLSQSLELGDHVPQRLPPQSSLTRWPDLVTPYRSQRHDRSDTLDMLDGDDRLNAVPELELESESSDGEAELAPGLMRYLAKRSSRSSTGDFS